MDFKKSFVYIKEHKSAKITLIVFFFIMGVIFAWTTVIYALTHNPFASDLGAAGKLPENENTISTPEKASEPDTNKTMRKLDGRQVSEADTNNFPVAVMIENLVPVRPQAGLSKASVVYESLVEGGITRFMALFDVQTEEVSKIGPVRSARPYYIEWLSEYNALYAHAGGSPEALQSISGFGIHDLNQIGGAAAYFWRDSGTSAPHNLFTSTELLQRALRDRNLDTEEPIFTSWNFVEKSKPDTISDEPNIRINYSTGISYQVEWHYDTAANEYLRFNGGRPHTDSIDGGQIRAKNIAIVIIPPVSDVGEKGRLTLDVHGTGNLFLLRDSEITSGTWKKENRLDRMEFLDADGKALELRPGATWVQIVPSDRTVEKF